MMNEQTIFQKSANGGSPFGEMSLKELSDVLGSTIVCDDVNKCIVFLAMLATYTESDQLTVCLLGQSSSGKTYLAQEIAKYFPKEDVHQYADVSPTAFKYSEGETATADRRLA